MPQPITLERARAWLKPRPKDANKGTAGRVLIVAGSRGMVGAAVLAALGAARSGAGLVKLAVVKSQLSSVVKRAPLEVTTMALPEDAAGRVAAKAWPLIRETIGHWKPTVIACGPGLGVTPAIVQLIDQLRSIPPMRLVLDADGLNAMARSRVRRGSGQMIITPHPGELARLLNVQSAQINKDREFFARRAAVKFGCVCLLKGAGTLVTDGAVVWRNTTGNPAMASGGMGDVLTGIVAALWAQDTESPLKAAALGAFLHGLAGDLALRDFPERSMLASDLAAALPLAYKKMWAFRRRES